MKMVHFLKDKITSGNAKSGIAHCTENHELDLPGIEKIFNVPRNINTSYKQVKKEDKQG